MFHRRKNKYRFGTTWVNGQNLDKLSLLFSTLLSLKQGIYDLEITAFFLSTYDLMTVWLHSKPYSYASFLWHACIKFFPAAASLWNCGQQWEARLSRFPLQIRDIRFCTLQIPFAWKINIVHLCDWPQRILSTTQEKGSMLMGKKSCILKNI